MAVSRVAIEHTINKAITLFRNIDYPKNTKLRANPVGIGTHFIVCQLLTNAHSCFYGNQVATFFRLPTPDIFEYFS